MSSSYRQLFDLAGKVAVVTGGLGILGRHFCCGLAEFGASVAVIDLDQSECEQFARELAEEYRVATVGIGCDVSDPASVQAMMRTAVSSLGPVTILHNNAATKTTDLEAFFAPTEQYSLQEWRDVMSVNIDGMFLVAQTVGSQMHEHGHGGSIIQTASIYGLIAPDQRIYEGSHYLDRQINTPAVYSASKAAVVGLSKYLAAYWGEAGIRVNTLVPGGVESGQNETFQQRYSARVPLGRMGHPSELVGALVYLSSDASSYVSGQCLIVDGGLSAW